MQSLEDAVVLAMGHALIRRRLSPRPWQLDANALDTLFLEWDETTRRHKKPERYDKWRNSGGKRGLWEREIPPQLVGGQAGLVLERRRSAPLYLVLQTFPHPDA